MSTLHTFKQGTGMAHPTDTGTSTWIKKGSAITS